MEPGQEEVIQTNFNDKWNNNILENIKNIESALRRARNGFEDIEELVQNPVEQWHILIPETMFQNLRYLVNELLLLLDDLIPVIEEKKFKPKVDELSEISEDLTKNGKVGILRYINSKVNHRTVKTLLLPKYWDILNKIVKIKRDLIIDIKDMLYVKSGVNPW